MQDLILRDNKIFRLQNEMLELKSEFNDMNSLNLTYFGKQEPTLDISQHIYNSKVENERSKSKRNNSYKQ